MSIYHHANEDMITQLVITHLRSIQQASFEFDPQFNLFIGSNGVGKTTVLEAIYLLSCGHSFRTRENHALINHEAERATVFTRLSSGDSIGLEKNRQAKTRVKVNGAYCRSGSQLAQLLPVQVIYQDIFQILDAGPAHRRSILDWGMFHVKHEYFDVWLSYQRALKQRNALLRKKIDANHAWDRQLIQYGEALTLMRLDYFSQLKLEFERCLQELISIDATIEFYQGWDKKQQGISLGRCFAEAYEKDLYRQYTQFGPHQADIIIRIKENKAKNLVSRGQQKLILIALKLAQIKLLNQKTVLLVDDFASELDGVNQQKLMSFIGKLNSQLFITSIEDKAYNLGKKFML